MPRSNKESGSAKPGTNINLKYPSDLGSPIKEQKSKKPREGTKDPVDPDRKYTLRIMGTDDNGSLNNILVTSKDKLVVKRLARLYDCRNWGGISDDYGTWMLTYSLREITYEKPPMELSLRDLESKVVDEVKKLRQEEEGNETRMAHFLESQNALTKASSLLFHSDVDDSELKDSLVTISYFEGIRPQDEQPWWSKVLDDPRTTYVLAAFEI